MEEKDFVFFTKTGLEIAASRFAADYPKAILVIIHGIMDHRKRYNHFLRRLQKEGFSSYIIDLPGHGETAGNQGKYGILPEQGSPLEILFDCILKLCQLVKEENPNKDLVLLGHSMGSMLARLFIYQHSELFQGTILSGPTGNQFLAAGLGKNLSSVLSLFWGKEYLSPFIHKLIFSPAEKSIDNAKTPLDWLSRDPRIVEKYQEDPFCGGYFSLLYYKTLLELTQLCSQSSNYKIKNKELSILIIAGRDDPIGLHGKGPSWVYKQYQKKGVQDLELRLYKDGRHEVLNEINREEVYINIIQWLNDIIKE